MRKEQRLRDKMNVSKDMSMGWLEFSLLIIKKIKHEFYDILEKGMIDVDSNEVREQQGLGKQVQQMDGLGLLQSGIFEKYQQLIWSMMSEREATLLLQSNIEDKQSKQQREIISQLVSHLCRMKQKQGQQSLYQQGFTMNNQKLQSNNQLKPNQLQSQQQRLRVNHYSQQHHYDLQLKQFLDTLQKQPDFQLSLTNNTFTITLKPSDQYNHPSTLQYNPSLVNPSLINNKQRTPSTYKSSNVLSTNQKHTHQQLSTLSPDNQLLSQSQDQNNLTQKMYQLAQRQLQFLIKEKQLYKKLHQSTQQIETLKSLLQQKQLIISQKQQQISQYKKLHQAKNRQDKVKTLKLKIQKESFIRELGLQRQRDSLQMLIEKQNINANLQTPSYLSACNSQIKYIPKTPNIFKSPRLNQADSSI